MSDSVDNHDTLTFVVRLWRDQVLAGGGACWRGRVEHVDSRQVAYVDGPAGIARFIARWTGPDQHPCPSGRRHERQP